jgi:hypothetical protein
MPFQANAANVPARIQSAVRHETAPGTFLLLILVVQVEMQMPS